MNNSLSIKQMRDIVNCRSLQCKDCRAIGLCSDLQRVGILSKAYLELFDIFKGVTKALEESIDFIDGKLSARDEDHLKMLLKAQRMIKEVDGDA